MNKIDSKREREKQTVALMISLYCRKNHGTKNNLCPDCEALSQYAIQRSDKCPFMETKTFCSNCRVHCYKPEMRGSYALFRTEDDILSSSYGYSPCVRK